MARLNRVSDFAPEQWDDWRWQMRNSISTVEGLAAWISVSPEETTAIARSAGRYRWRVTPYYASLMDPLDPACPIRRQAIPSEAEFVAYEGADIDPVGDTTFRRTNRVIHKYPDRVVLLVTDSCPVYCRFCTRKYHTTDLDGTYFERGANVGFEKDIAYIEAHPEIRDVLLTGGDPLMFADHKLDALLLALRSIPHVEIIRIGSRFPVLLPQRITPEFCAMVERHHPIWFSTHFNHPRELTLEAALACDRLIRHGIPVQNQTVLLKSVNDDPETMRALLLGLLRARVKPYYLYHCDNVSGVSHFMTSIEAGRRIMAGLLGHVSGYALPRYIITTALGKIPLERGFVEADDEGILLENYRGETLRLGGGLRSVPGPAVGPV